MKPTILLMDLPRLRSPLLNQFYNYISREDGPFNIVRPTKDDWNFPIERVINKVGFPDYIYWGFTPGSGLAKSKDYLLKNRDKVKIIIDPGDYEVFTSRIPGTVANFESVWVDYVIVRCPKIKGYRTMNIVEDFISTQDWLQGAKIINVPWGIDPKLYPEKNLERDIDVSLIATASNHFWCHEERLKAFEVLKELSGEINVFANTYLGPKMFDEDIFRDDYLDILYRSKIFIVTSAGRDFMVQKYLEGPACGAMLLGEIPTPARPYLKDGVSMVEVKDFNKLKEVILENLRDKERIKRIAEEGRKQILENFTVDKVAKEFEETILEDYKRR